MVRKIIFFLLLYFVLSASRLFAWQIDNFDVDIVVNKDSSLLIREEIVADFSGQPKHGIIRNIPIFYRDETGRSIHLEFQVLGIYDENGNAWQYSEYPSGVYKVLKVGSPYVTYDAKKTFVIKYKVRGAILYLENHDELFWNAIGTEWDCPIEQVKINLTLPEPMEKEGLMTTAYSGRFGSRANDVKTSIIDKQQITFTGSRYLPYEGLTIVVGWPKGIVEVVKLTSAEEMPAVPGPVSFGAFANFGRFFFVILLAIPLLVFLIMFNIWRKYGKDPQLQKSVVVEYKVPEGLTPAEMGTLIDDKIDIRDISATIIDLAVRGYLKIIKEDAMFFQKKYSFVILKDFSKDETLKAFEKAILRGVFGSFSRAGDSVALSELENNFYNKLPDIKDEIFKHLINSGFYKDDPEKTVKYYRGFGTGIFFIAVFISVLFPLALSLAISAVIIFAFAKYMPAKTRKGMDVYGRVLGFEEFLTRTDKDKIQFEERQNIFEKMLPFAICLGISTQWAKIFADIYKQAPAWFSGDYRGGFSVDNFMYDLNRSVSSMNNTFISMPRTVSSGGGFGGGGSSGGGFGGGGGSSW